MRTPRLASWTAAALLAVLPACVGIAPGDPGGDDVGDDGGDPSAGVAVSGMTMDYFTGLPISNAALATEGMTPAVSATSAADGNYTLEDVPPGSLFYVSATRSNYRATRNDMVTVTDVDLTANVWLVSTADANRQYAGLGLTPTADTAIAIADLLRNNGEPLVGTPLADITLVDGLGAPVGLGPYFFGEAGDVVSNDILAVSTAFGTPPRARVAYLDVAPGSYTLKINYLSGDGGGGGGGGGEIRTYEVPVVVVASGAALVSTGGQDNDGTPTGTPSFATDIHPLLQRGGDGGLGCANCHTANGVMTALQFDLAAADTLAAIVGRPGVVDPANPALSLLLSKPLYEQPPALQNHPNATFASDLDPNYQSIMTWIAAGTPP